MELYTYTVGHCLTLESEIEIFLLDTEPEESIADPDIRIRVGTGNDTVVERTANGLEVSVPPSMATERTGETEPVSFMKVFFTAIQEMLLEQEATLCFGSAFRTPDGDSVGLFGPSNCGKSTATFQLAQEQDYRIVADDLLVCHDGKIYPFPRYMNLPRDVPEVRRWLQSETVPDDQIAEWQTEVGVPRRLVSKTIPTRLELDYVLIVPPENPRDTGTTRISIEQSMTTLGQLYESALLGWTVQPTVRELFDSEETDWKPIVKQAITGATCYRLAVSGGRLAESVVRVLGR